MSKYTHDIVIVGGGAGGLVTTVGCARLGMKTAVVERAALGGDCLYHGCVPSKSLLKAASLLKQTRELPAYGLPQASLGSVNMRDVNARVKSVISDIEKHDSPERFRSMGAEVFFGESRFRSPHELELEGGETLSAPRFVLATGSSPRVIPIPGLEEAGYITNLDAFDLEELPSRLTVLGAGPIGTELGQAFARLGSRVTLIDVASHILPQEDEDMAAFVQQQLEDDGVSVRAGVRVERVEASKETVIHRGDTEERIPADEILVAVGRQGNSDGLELGNAGVAVEKGFITTDSKLRTSARHIHAIGDCNGRYLFTHVASAEASVVVRRVALRVGGNMNYQNVPWVTYTEPELASIGYNETRAAEAGLDYRVLRQDFETNDRAHAEGLRTGLLKIILDARDRVLGVQIASERAGELLLPSLYAVSDGWKVGKLMSPIVPYPTLGEIHRRAAGEYMGRKLFNDRVRGILRFLYRYRGSGS